MPPYIKPFKESRQKLTFEIPVRFKLRSLWFVHLDGKPITEKQQLPAAFSEGDLCISSAAAALAAVYVFLLRVPGCCRLNCSEPCPLLAGFTAVASAC